MKRVACIHILGLGLCLAGTSGRNASAAAIVSATSGNWDVATTWSPQQVPTAADSVTILTNHTVSIRVLTTNEVGNLTIDSGGVLTHQVHTSTEADTETYKVVVEVATNLALHSGGQINVAGKGFEKGYGPGKSLGTKRAAGHGGQGGAVSADITDNGKTYSSITAPTALGSGGQSTYADSPGGGAVILTVGGTTALDGDILADAGSGRYYTSSGGSVFLRTGALAGSGVISANGGNASNHTSGGGGRIAVILTNSTGFGSVTMRAFPGSVGTGRGSCGTIYLEHGGHNAGQGRLVVDQNDTPSVGSNSRTIQNQSAASSYAFSEIVLTNGAVYEVDADDSLDIGSTAIQGDPDDALDMLYVDGGTLTIPTGPLAWTDYALGIGPGTVFSPDTSLTVGTNAALVMDRPWTTAVPVTVAAGGVISHSPNQLVDEFRLDLTLNGAVDIQAGGAVDVKGKGFRVRQGPGKPTYYAGASHGGTGSDYTGTPGITYGSVKAPAAPGSGGDRDAGNGGGNARLRVKGTLALAGWLCADASDTTHYSGSGGSVYLTCGAITGGGTISANGGKVSGSRSGGGGRVAVVLTNSTDFSGVTLQARTGAGPTKGAAGTVYMGYGDGADAAGVLVIDNGGLAASGDEATELPPDYDGAEPAYQFNDDLTRTSLDVRDGELRLAADDTLAFMTVTGATAVVDLYGHTLNVMPDLLVGESRYGVGTYTAAALGSQIEDTTGGGSIVVRPVIDNAGGATNVTTTSAWLNGTLYAADASTALYVYWGTTDGSNEASRWQHTNTWIAPQDAGDLHHQVAGANVASERVNYYTFRMTDASRTNWAAPSEVFMTSEVWIETTADASEIRLTPGTFTIHRGSEATNGDITIYYTASGSATAGLHYVDNLTGALVLPEGQESAPLTVTPIQYDGSQCDETVTVTIATGPYAAGNPSSADMTIENLSMPAAPTNVWIGAGNASQATNWSLGTVPAPTNDVLLGGYSTADIVWDVETPVASWRQNTSYTGTVTFATVFPGVGAFTNGVITGDCTLEAGTWTHRANAGGAAAWDRLCLTIGGDLLIHSQAQVNVTGQGFAAGQGPGAATDSGYAAGHGGQGGCNSLGAVAQGKTYDSVTAPAQLGSGGAGGWPSRGGGAVLLHVAGNTTLDGAILADGGTADHYTASGGTIFLRTGALAGTGVISASGGNANNYTAGGGGRIAVVVTNATDFGNVVLRANPGAGGTIQSGAAGTVYLEHTGHASGHGRLLVDQNDLPTAGVGVLTVQNGLTPSTNAFAEIILSNGGVYALDGDDALDIRSTAIEGEANDPAEGLYLAGGRLIVPAGPFAWTNFILGVAEGSSFFPSNSVSVGTNAWLVVDGAWTSDVPVTVKAGGRISHTRNAGVETYKLDLTVLGDLVIESGGAIDVDAKGYQPGSGPGYLYSHDYGWTGAGHGGEGGYSGTRVPGLVYGSITAPTRIGSGGVYSGARGGGAAIVVVAGDTRIDGTVSAEGADTTYYAPSGGSVYITTGTLSGNGSISAKGGDASNYSQGGGGRIAVVVTNGTELGGISMAAYSGNGTYPGSPGTVYTQTRDQGAGGGTLRVVADQTPLPDSETIVNDDVGGSTHFGSVIIGSGVEFVLASNRTVTVTGSWTNNGSLVAETDATVVMTGAGEAFLTGDNAFYNYSAVATGGKTIQVEAGATQSVAGTLTLNNVTLCSTSPGDWWYLDLSASGGTQDVSAVQVRDGNADLGQTIHAQGQSRNLGHNVNWVFPACGTLFHLR